MKLIKIDQYYIPNVNQLPIIYLKDVESEKKKSTTNYIKHRHSNCKVFKLQGIKLILVPQYEELTSDKIYAKVKGYVEKFKDYFSHYDESYIHPREYFWDISSTLNQEFAEKFINYFIKNKQKINQESKIEISEEIISQINKKYFYTRQKGKKLYDCSKQKICEVKKKK